MNLLVMFDCFIAINDEVYFHISKFYITNDKIKDDNRSMYSRKRWSIARWDFCHRYVSPSLLHSN